MAKCTGELMSPEVIFNQRRTGVDVFASQFQIHHLCWPPRMLGQCLPINWHIIKLCCWRALGGPCRRNGLLLLVLASSPLFAPLGQPLAGGTDTALPSAPKSLSNTSLTSMSLTSSAQGTSLGTTSPGPLEVRWPVSPSGATPQQISPPHEHSHTLSNEI